MSRATARPSRATARSRVTSFCGRRSWKTPQYAGLGISADEVFISDGSKCDTGNILDIFGKGNVIAITDPVYPVYVDTNVMAGNTGDADEKGAYAGLL